MSDYKKSPSAACEALFVSQSPCVLLGLCLSPAASPHQAHAEQAMADVSMRRLEGLRGVRWLVTVHQAALGPEYRDTTYE